MYPPPPIPLDSGSTTPTARHAATPASTAFPPILSISSPASVDKRSFVATIPLPEWASLLVKLAFEAKLLTIHILLTLNIVTLSMIGVIIH